MGDTEVEAREDLPYETKVARASIIAKPMASKKLSKKLFKLIKKGEFYKIWSVKFNIIVNYNWNYAHFKLVISRIF